MEFKSEKSLNSKKLTLVVIPFCSSKKGAQLAGQHSLSLNSLVFDDFKGNEGESLLLYPEHSSKNRVLLLGLGESKQLTVEKLRRAFSIATKEALKKRIDDLTVDLPVSSPLSSQEVMQGVVEGLLLPNYLFLNHKHAEPAPKLIKRITFLQTDREVLKSCQKFAHIMEGVTLARDLVNENADFVTPLYLADVASGLSKEDPKHISVQILDKKALQRSKFELLLAVSRGSLNDPALIILSYTGEPTSKDHTVIVGKGVTFDTGGLHLKPYGGMETMRADMAGAAACLGLVKAASKIHLKANFTVVIPSVENSIDARSYKPGDVYSSLSGKTVEIMNTDAEGRLILADAITYAIQYLKPSRIIDIATLTGAMDIALGPEASGLMSNQDKLAEQLLKASQSTHERIWRLPLIEEYKEKLKSDIADLKNVGGGRSAGSIKSALFLKEFVGDLPWAHLDIASTAYLQEPQRYLPKNATGVGVRLLLEFLEHL